MDDIDFFFSFRFRPETVESLFIAFRLTGDERFRKFGWDIFQAIEAHCRVETGGYSSVWNVDAVPTTRIDNMETFFLVGNHSFTLREMATDREAERNSQIPLPAILGSEHLVVERWVP